MASPRHPKDSKAKQTTSSPSAFGGTGGPPPCRSPRRRLQSKDARSEPSHLVKLLAMPTLKDKPKNKKKNKTPLADIADKYALYGLSVQEPANEAEFFHQDV